nr:heavy metal-binding domain-containing protein [Nitrospirota bacterium]
MMCPLCGVGILPGKICINCGYDPSRPGVRPSAKPAAPEPPNQDAKPDPLASIRDMLPTKKSKAKQKDKAAVEPATPPPPLPQGSTLQQASVPVTTQFAFEGQHIVGYAGLVVATVVIRLGKTDELLPAGLDMQRLSGGPIGMRLRKAIDLAIADLKTEALERGANGVVGARLEVLPAHSPLAIVTLIGTAVVLE